METFATFTTAICTVQRQVHKKRIKYDETMQIKFEVQFLEEARVFLSKLR
jgi:hypothetical protein